MEYHFLYFLVVISYPIIQFSVEAKTGGFTVEIIHRDSPLSPFYNHSATLEDLARNDALRSIARANHFRQSNSLDESKVQSPVSVTPNGGADYLMKLSIGTPPVEFLAVADTGSDLIWVQCEPCNGQCYPQDGPLFNSLSSSTYMELPCDSQPCQVPENNPTCTNNVCGYSIGYGDNSYTSGVLATETLTFDNTNGQVAAFPNSVFGCGNNNGGKFDRHGSGIVGLGGGPQSLVSQLGAAQIQQIFSYCLLPRNVNSASKLKFGTDAVITAPGVVSTPYQSDISATFYDLTLEGVTVGSRKIAYSGKVIIDSGTTLTILEPGFYYQLEAEVKTAIVGLNQVQGNTGDYSLCYDTSSSAVPEMTMVFQFTGAAVTLNTLNIFRVIGPYTCLTIVPSKQDPNGNLHFLYGNWAQMNFQVEYDLEKKQVSFAPADCTQY